MRIRVRIWTHLTASLCLVMGVASCRQPLTKAPAMEWTRVDSLARNLPSSIEIFAGKNDALPLRAWYVKARVSADDVSASVVVSADDDKRQSPSDLAKANDSCVLLNAGYFDMGANPSRHAGLLVIDEKLLAGSTRTVVRDSVTYMPTRSALGVLHDGSVDVAWAVSNDGSVLELNAPLNNRPGFAANPPDSSRFQDWPARDAVGAGPSLISNGEVQVTDQEEVFFGSTVPAIHPRSAAGVTQNGDLILLVVDGRQPWSRGVDLEELAGIMYNLGAHEALNLDGGGSSAMIAAGQLLNRPTGGSVEREVMSGIALNCE